MHRPMQRRTFLSGAATLAAGLSAPKLFAAETGKTPFAYPLTHAVADASAPVVYFTKDVSPEGLIRAYEALKQKVGKTVGLKMTFEAPGAPYLDPALPHALAKKLHAKMIDNNCYPPRDTAEKHLQVAADHGFDTKLIDILDAEGYMDLPVKGKHLTFTRTGSHFANYDTLVSLVRFKAHFLDFYGGTLKNLSICMGTPDGKRHIHSAGETMSSFSSRDDRTTCEAMADAVKAAMDAKPGRWVFLNVLDTVDPRDSCDGTKNLGNIGILASADPVALDQAAIDITFGAAATPQLRAEWEETHSTMLTQIAEDLGVGKTHYRFQVID